MVSSDTFSSACSWRCWGRRNAFSLAISCSIWPRYIRTERGAGYIFAVPVQTIY
jgi:hypothetical protein